MSKIKDSVIGIGVSSFLLILWVYEMLVTSDIPVEISFNNAVLISCLLVLFLVVYSLYIRKTKYILMNIMLLLMPLSLWFASMQQALRYQYHRYDTIVSIIGFVVALIAFSQVIYLKLRK
ncbi:hypothetical protein [Desnuesiella massiliensis]|uniref:hypothetical protein n=1 Tax=Desnuesiella massiliensis TaxID=1650662 RepID=UPI0006E2D006|nr:hypothetical protein [Desnuesiella massiliensis]